MNLEQNKQLFRRVAEELFNQHDLSAVDRYYSPKYVQHVPDRAARAADMGVDSREETKGFFGALFAAFPDLRIEIEHLHAEGDRVFCFVKLHGTHAGPFMGAPPSGKKVAIRAADIFRVEDGRFAEHWDVVDEKELLAALGALQPRG